MATGGVGWRIQKGYEGQKFSVKRFAYDVLYVTLLKCGFPKTLLRVKLDEENDYRHTDYVITVHSAVMCIAFSMRDKWKHMFEYKQKSFVLNDMQKVEEYLTKIEVLPEFRLTDDLDKIRRSLAFYSELSLFLIFKNLEVNFEKLLDIWSNYFNQKIAVSEDPDILLEAIFIEDPDIVGYLSLVDCFIRDVANPYGKKGNVSKRFKDFSQEVENFYESVGTDVAELTKELLASHPKSTSCNMLDPPSEAVEESVSFFSAILDNDSSSSTSHKLPERSRGFPLPSLSVKWADEMVEGKKKNIVDKQSNVEDTALPGPRKSPEPPSEMATGKIWRIQKGYEGQKFSVKRFAYDMLYITLLKCGFPKTLLRVELDKENDYRHPDYVKTVRSAVMCIAFSMRDEWKRMFEYKQKSFVLNDMRKVEEYLTKIEVLPEFRLTDDLDKIRRSLAFYSELSLFLHFNNLEVDFEKLLEIWSNYFNEKIAVNEDPDILLEAIFIEYPYIGAYLNMVDCFIQEFANPYGKISDVSRRFKDFSEDVEKFNTKPRISLAETFELLMLSRLELTPQNLLRPLSGTIEESVAFFSTVLGSESVLSRNRNSPEPQ